MRLLGSETGRVFDEEVQVGRPQQSRLGSQKNKEKNKEQVAWRDQAGGYVVLKREQKKQGYPCFFC